jgi:hypothetical protein
MKYVKMLGLAAIAAAALMAFLGAGTASATVLCKNATCTEDYPSGTEIEATLSGSAILETTGGTVLDTCTGGKVSGKTSSTSGTPLTGAISALTWEGCTKTTKTLTNGSLAIEHTSGVDGTLSATGTEVTVNTIFGSCVFGPVGSLTLGTLKGGAPATLTINTIIPRISGPCPSEARWTASYTVTKPNPLYIG